MFIAVELPWPSLLDRGSSLPQITREHSAADFARSGVRASGYAFHDRCFFATMYTASGRSVDEPLPDKPTANTPAESQRVIRKREEPQSSKDGHGQLHRDEHHEPTTVKASKIVNIVRTTAFFSCPLAAP